MLSIVLDDSLANELRRAADATGQDVNNYAIAVLRKDLDHKQGEKVSDALYGPARTLSESDTAFRAVHSIPNLSHLTEEELQTRADAALAALTPEQRLEAERLGLI